MTWWSLFIQTLYSCYTTSWDSTADDVAWAKLGNADSDNLLEDGEVFEVVVDVSTYGLTDGDEFAVQVKPPSGAVLNLARSIPARIEDVMDIG